MPSLSEVLQRFVPVLTPVSNQERLRAAIGALIGVVATGLVTRWALGSSSNVPLLIAPMGASAVLLFAVPASPLAQPWSILGGNLVAALVGVTAAIWVKDTFLAAGLAVAGAIALMLALRCLHPPSGAVALTAVLGGPAIQALGYSFVLWPVAVNSIAILATALVFNNLTGRRYSHAGPAAPAVGHGTSDPPPLARLGFTDSDIEAALRDYNRLLDVDRSDLENVLRQAELRAYLRRSGGIVCADIMSRNVVSVAPGTLLSEALALLRQHRIKALPVTEGGTVVGILTQTDLLEKPAWEDGLGATALERMRRAFRRQPSPGFRVADIMTAPVRSATPQTPVADLVPLMADGGLHHLPVLDEAGRLVGIVTQTDVIAALFNGLPTEGRDAAPRE